MELTESKLAGAGGKRGRTKKDSHRSLVCSSQRREWILLEKVGRSSIPQTCLLTLDFALSFHIGVRRASYRP